MQCQGSLVWFTLNMKDDDGLMVVVRFLPSKDLLLIHIPAAHVV
jgi:hypothetical protein